MTPASQPALSQIETLRFCFRCFFYRDKLTLNGFLFYLLQATTSTFGFIITFIPHPPRAPTWFSISHPWRGPRFDPRLVSLPGSPYYEVINFTPPDPTVSPRNHSDFHVLHLNRYHSLRAWLFLPYPLVAGEIRTKLNRILFCFFNIFRAGSIHMSVLSSG